MKDLIKKNISGRKVIFLFILTNIVYMIMLTITIPKVMSYSGSMKILDMMPMGYTPEYVKSLFITLGENGRFVYLYNQLPVDMVYPLLFGVSSCLVLAYFLNKLEKLDGPLYYLCLIPLLSGLFDYGENIGIIKMLNTFPDNSAFVAQITNVFSILKSSFTTTYFIVLIFILLVLAKEKLFYKVR